MPKNMSAPEISPSRSNCRTTQFKDLGIIGFREAWKLQEELFEDIATAKTAAQSLPAESRTHTSNWLLFCEHPHVYTLGKSGDRNNLLLTSPALEAAGAEFVHVNRGGDITYHGPGQIVAYPILNLEYFVKGAKEYIHKLEEAVIIMLAKYHVKGERLPGATGVWIDPHIPGKARKICAMGVRTSRWISMHGLALNINTILSYFNHINPCGFTDKQVTSLGSERGETISVIEAKQFLKDALAEVFEMELIG
jgi:lipoyl(octanoyl) transferase